MTEPNNPISYQLERPTLFKHLSFVGDVLDIGCNAGANVNYLKLPVDNVELSFNLPGNPKAVREYIEILAPVLPHALEVLADNERAIQLYQKLGFRQIGQLAEHYLQDQRWHDVVLMERMLSP